MKDRIPRYAGRVKLSPVAGQPDVYDMTRADSPEQEGTPLNRETLLSEAVQTLLGLGDSATPSDAIGALANSVKDKSRVAVGTYRGTGTYGSDNPNVITVPFRPKLVIVVCSHGSNSDSAVGFLLPWDGAVSDYSGGLALMTTPGRLVNTFTDTSVSWYSTATYPSAGFQLNYILQDYYWVAIG